MTRSRSIRSALVAALATACLLAVPATADDATGIRLLKDIAPSDAPSGTVGTFGIAHALPSGDKILFVGNDGDHGNELWITDGTTAGTTLVKDIYPGLAGSSPYRFASFKGKVYFTADTLEHGIEPWVTDGTAAGTTLLKDTVVGPVGGNPADFGVAGDKLFFGVSHDTQPDSGLWVSDGTSAGTTKLDVPALDSEFNRATGFATLGDQVVFVGRDAAHGAEPWVSDGTAAGTRLLQDTYAGADGVNNLHDLVSLGDQVLFLAKESGDLDHFRLWRTDGTAAGTRKVGDTRADVAYLDFGPVRYHDKLIFMGYRAGEGYELWSSDGTDAGTTLVKDIRPGPGHSWPNQMQIYQDKIYFAVDTADAEELWVTEGTAASTRSVKKLLVREAGDPGSPGAPFGSTGGVENPSRLTVAGGRLYFGAETTLGSGNRLWSTDGTTAGTALVPSPAGLFLLIPMGEVGGHLVLPGSSQTYGNELWVKDLVPVRATSIPRITGTRLVGSRLTSTVGTWSQNATFTREWLRNGTVIAGATGTTYVLSAADAGKIIAVRVTARTADGVSTSATSLRTATVKFRSATSATVKRKGRKVTLTVKVASAGKSNGTIRVKDGSRVVKVVTLTKGTARVVLRKQTVRKHRYTVIYDGTSTVAGSKDAASIRVR